jgi:hypothetical protein
MTPHLQACKKLTWLPATARLNEKRSLGGHNVSISTRSTGGYLRLEIDEQGRAELRPH